MVSKGRKTAADAARLFKVHPATVCVAPSAGLVASTMPVRKISSIRTN